MKTLKNILPDVLMVLLFAAVSFAYFYPADIEGRILYREDASAGRGLGQDVTDYTQATGETSRWTNSAFSGMPTYQSAPSYESTDLLSSLSTIYHMGLPEYVWYVFVYLLGFYILLRAFDFRWHLAALGSVIWAFSSYFFIIIAAGHIWKVMALAYLPPMIGGMILAYRGKYLPALAVMGIFTAFEIKANHVQMTYYYMFIMAFLFIAFLIDAILKKSYIKFLKATLVCIAAGILGVAVNASNLYHTWEYQKETMRGKSELVKDNPAKQTSSGLDRDYITQWSYGIDETWTLLVPNTKGGSSWDKVSAAPEAKEKGNPELMPIYDQIGQYWGEQPMTSGPVYIGAFVCMLFVLGLLIVKGPVKWALFLSTLLSIMLSWGHNLMWFTDLFIDYMPLYAKFRTVSSILVVAEFTMPLLGMLGLKQLIENSESVTRKVGSIKINCFYVSFAVTAGICLLFAMMPTVFFDRFVSSQEMQALSSLPQEYQAPLISNLTEIREAIFRSDCIRSFIIILICAAVLAVYRFKKLPALAAVIIITIVCLFDMWQVNKRYLNDGMFVSNTLRTAPIEPTKADLAILEDKDLDYRVLNFENTFNENRTSFFHKSIGGYHAAKLRRYQELIENHIAPEMQKAMGALASTGGDLMKVNGDSIMPVINMLNTKYFIVPLQSGEQIPVPNPWAKGNGWYVSKMEYVDNANKEIDALGTLDLNEVAVADKQFQALLGETQAQDTASYVRITSYTPNELHYDVNSTKGGVVVFSEVYYPGWTATVDGNPVEIGRANYVLRAINVPAGSHKVVLEFRPKSLTTTETVAVVSFVLLMLSVIGAVGMQIWKSVKKTDK